MNGAFKLYMYIVQYRGQLWLIETRYVLLVSSKLGVIVIPGDNFARVLAQ